LSSAAARPPEPAWVTVAEPSITRK
jgi:hypothetical protein